MILQFLRQYFRLYPLLAILCAQSINFHPEFNYKYESDSDQYSSKNTPIQNYELIIIGQYKAKKLNIMGRLGYHLLDGAKIEANKPVNLSDFTHAQGLHWITKSPGLLDDQSNYYVADMQIRYGDVDNFFYFNKWPKHWGPGINSLTISTKIPNFFHFGFKQRLGKNILFEYFHGKLKSNITDTNYVNYYDELEGRPFDIVRNIAGHRLELRLNKQIVLSGSEIVVYANRFFEMTYLLPFLPFFPVEEYVGETDNVIMSVDIQYLPRNNICVYGVLMIDEWSPPVTFDKDNHNWFGWQTGIEWTDFLIITSRFRLEYTWTDHRIYRHRFPVNDYYSYNYPVGFWAGPHAEELYIDYSFPFKENMIELLYSNSKRGELTDAMLIDKYHRPSNKKIYERFGADNQDMCDDCVGTVESRRLFSISIKRKFTKEIDISFQYSYIDWKNAGFTPTNPQSEENLPEIIKHSVGITILYRN